MGWGLYVHIPYCRSKCRYCDFYSGAVRGGVPDAYIDALLRDLVLYAPKDEAGAAEPPETVYFGGGTPGLLQPEQVHRVLEAAAPMGGAEVTLETNPGLGDGHMAGWRAAGVTRLSIGVQTAFDDSLARLGRTHTAEEARAAFAAARAAGFAHLTGDIMLALPGYSRAEFDATLALIEQGGADHVSAYLLKLEPGTPMAERPPVGLPDEDEAADQYLYAVERLEARGFGQYEISNFAKPGGEGRHNLRYWRQEDTLGLGPGAHSMLGGRRFSFPRKLAAFLDGKLPATEEGQLDAEDYIMLQLRLAEGLALQELERRFGVCFTPRQTALMQGFERAGYARATAEGWALTPKGLLVQNSILASLLA